MPTPAEHLPTYTCEPPMLDTFECSCGWKSRVYYDGAEYAQAEWKRHVVAATSTEPVKAGDSA